MVHGWRLDPILLFSQVLIIITVLVAGWENIQEWNPNPKTEKPKKVFQGTNKKHPELGIFVPDYVRDLNAITKAFDHLKLGYTLSSLGYAACGIFEAYALEPPSPAIALCKLLLELTPDLKND
jgi:hypothetical protein